MKHFFSFVWLMAGLCASLGAAAQSLDATFQPSSLYMPAPVYQVVEQPNGKLVMTSNATRVGTTAVGLLSRLNADGTVDAAFGQNVGLGEYSDEVYALPNNQLLLRGSFEMRIGNLTRRELLRLNADGTPDATLDAGTGATNSDPNLYAYTSSMAVQPDGKIVLAGLFDEFSAVPTHNLIRLNADGSIDPSFQLATGPDADVYALAQQADGKFLIGGQFQQVGGQTRRGLARLNNDGTLDTSFVPALDGNSSVEAIRVQPDGNILIAGSLNFGSGGTLYITRLTATGARETTFNPPLLDSNLAAGYGLNPLQLQADGKIILIGYFREVNGTPRPGIARINSNGSLDTSFNPGTGPNSNGGIYTATLGTSGKLYVGGYFTRFGGRASGLVRLTTTGGLDAGFTPQPLRVGQVNALLRQPDGKVIIGGQFTELGGREVYNLARLNADGTPDNTFTAPDTQNLGVNFLVLQPDGKVVSASATNYGLTNPVVLQRFTATGATDPAFTAGLANTNGATPNIAALALQPDGRLLVAGSALNGSSMVRLLPSGQVDGSFGLSMPAGLGYLSRGTALALQPNGSIVLAGLVSPGSGGGSFTMRVLRVSATGAADNGFSTQPTFTSATSSSYGTINVLHVQPGGTILVGGQFGQVVGARQSGLARLTANGQLDAAFNANFTLNLSQNTNVQAILTQPNGRILLGGTFVGPSLTPNLARLLPDGRPDASFSATLGVGRVRTLDVQPDGKILLGGAFGSVLGQPYVGVARLTAPNVLAVGRTQSAALLQAWPVPAHSTLHLRLDAGAQPTRVTLLDATGKTHLVQAQPAADLTLPLQHLAAGVYLLRVDYADGPVTRRVVVE